MLDPGKRGRIYQDLARFRVQSDFRERSGLAVLARQVVQATLFPLSPQPFHSWRRLLLRPFGGEVGRGVLVRPTARVTCPWKVRLGDHCWIGDHAEIYSLGPISIGAHAVVSQRGLVLFVEPAIGGQRLWPSGVRGGDGLRRGDSACDPARQGFRARRHCRQRRRRGRCGSALLTI